MEGEKLKLVVDGMALPLEGEMAEAACLYHVRKGDRVIRSEGGSVAEVYTQEGNSTSLSMEYAEIVSGIPYELWDTVTKKLLGRGFDPTLDLNCYSCESGTTMDINFEGAPENHHRVEFKRISYIQTRESAIIIHRGRCSGNAPIHSHFIEFEIDIELERKLFQETKWNSDQLRAEIAKIEKGMIITGESEYDTGSEDEPGNIQVPSGTTWYDFLASEFLKSVMSAGDVISARISLYQRDSLIAYAETERGHRHAN